MKLKDIKTRIAKKEISRTIPLVNTLNGSVTWNTLVSNVSLLEAYQEVPDVQFIVNYIANQFSKTDFIMTDGDRVIESHPVLDLLNNPNYYQNWYELLKQFISYYEIFGNAYLNAFAPVGMSPSNLFVLPSQNVVVGCDANTKDFRQVRPTSYDVIMGTITKIAPEYVMHKRNTNLNQEGTQILYGQSNLIAGSKPITSVLGSYEAKVTYYQNRGALGILTSSTSGSDAFNAPTDSDVNDLQKKLKNYGLSRDQYQFIVTKSAMNWQSMSQNMSDLQIMESTIADRRTIANLLGVPALIFTDESATFSNKKEVMREFWGAKAIPLLDDFYNDLTNFLKNWWKGSWKLEADYSNITELKDDQNSKHDRLMKDIQNGVRSINEVREELGIDLSTQEGADELLFNNPNINNEQN